MKRDLICKLLYIISIILVIAFTILLAIDYSKYDSIINSAPFSAYVIVRLIEFVIPAFVCFLIARIRRKRK